MKSAGTFPVRSPPVANGWWSCANGIAPLSYQTSMTSGSRRISPPQGHVSRTSSTNGRCGSRAPRAAPWPRPAQLGERPHRLHRAAVAAAPQRQRGAPVAVARDRPVDVALQPLAEAPVPHPLGVPADLPVDLQHPVLHRGGADVPGGLGVVEERRAAAPAVGVGVAVHLGAEQQAAGVEVGDQVGVGLLHQAVGEHPDGVGEAAVGPDRVGGVQPVVAGGGHVVLAEGRGDVDDPGAVPGRDERGVDHPVGALDVRERGLVLPAHQLVERRERADGRASSPSTFATSGSAMMSVSSPTSTAAYVTSGATAAAWLDGSVHGVVVHTSSDASSSRSRKRTYTDGSSTSS